MNSKESWALDVIESAEVVNEFTNKVWLSVTRETWDRYLKYEELYGKQTGDEK